MPARSGAKSPRAESNHEQVDLVFDNNRLASALYGEFDQNLALIERRLGVDARARGNMVTLSGPTQSLALARRVLDSLYERLLEGQDVL
jgi:phosphate starvation-inducible PhoH-like protein